MIVTAGAARHRIKVVAVPSPKRDRTIVAMMKAASPVRFIQVTVADWGAFATLDWSFGSDWACGDSAL